MASSLVVSVARVRMAGSVREPFAATAPQCVAMTAACFPTPATTRRLLALTVLLLAGCAAPARLPPAWPGSLAQLLPADVLLLGEQHDAPAHQTMERAAVQWLAASGRLSALVIEMADAGRSTAGLAPGAGAAQGRGAPGRGERLWPRGGHARGVLGARAAGGSVPGGHLAPAPQPRAQQAPPPHGPLAPGAHAAQLHAVREGHCGLLPEAQLPGMVRIQIARDQSMARTVAAAPRAPGRVVLLVAGGGHVLRSRGVPVHLPKNLRQKVVLAHAGVGDAAIDTEADMRAATAALPAHDACAPLRAQAAARE